jgi:hypothetical protein
MAGNDTPGTATPVVIASVGAGYDSGLVANTGLTVAGSADEPETFVTGAPWYRVGWWRYRPTADGTMNVYNGPTRNVGVLSVFSGTPGALVYINAYYGGDTHTLAVAAGQTYWFAVGNIEGNGDDNYRLQVTSAPTSVPEDPGGGGVTPTPLDLGTATLTVPVLLAAAPLEDRNRLDAGPVGVPVHLAPAVLRNTGGVVVAAGVARARAGPRARRRGPGRPGRRQCAARRPAGVHRAGVHRRRRRPRRDRLRPRPRLR